MPNMAGKRKRDRRHKRAGERLENEEITTSNVNYGEIDGTVDHPPNPALDRSTQREKNMPMLREKLDTINTNLQQKCEKVKRAETATAASLTKSETCNQAGKKKRIRRRKRAPERVDNEVVMQNTAYCRGNDVAVRPPLNSSPDWNPQGDVNIPTLRELTEELHTISINSNLQKQTEKRPKVKGAGADTFDEGLSSLTKSETCNQVGKKKRTRRRERAPERNQNEVGMQSNTIFDNIEGTWKVQRKESVRKLKELSEKLDKIEKERDTTSVGVLPLLMKIGNLVPGMLVDGVPNMIESHVSANHMREVEAILEKDKELSRPLLEWFNSSSELDATIKRIFNVGLSSAN